MSELYLSEQLDYQPCIPLAAEVIDNPYYQEYLQLSQKQWMFSDLLMMDKENTILTSNTQKIKVLNLLYHLYKSAAEAIYAFYIDRKVELFDAHVGESACQVRAAYLITLVLSLDLRVSTTALAISQEFENMGKRVKRLLEEYEIPHKNLDGSISLNDFLEKHRIDHVNVNKHYIFLITSYILCKYKKIISIDFDVIEYIRIMQEWSLPKNQVKNVVVKLQRICSLLTIDAFLLYQNNDDYRMNQLVCYQIRKDLYHRWLLPCLETMDWIIQLISKYQLALKIDVLIENDYGQVVDSYRIFYSKDKCFSEEDASTEKNKPCIIFEAFVRSNKFTGSPKRMCAELNGYALDAILNANTASHLPYPCRSLGQQSSNPYKISLCHLPQSWLANKLSSLRNLQALAVSDGFCKRYPYRLAISHIRCAMR